MTAHPIPIRIPAADPIAARLDSLYAKQRLSLRSIEKRTHYAADGLEVGTTHTVQLHHPAHLRLIAVHFDAWGTSQVVCALRDGEMRAEAIAEARRVLASRGIEVAL